MMSMKEEGKPVSFVEDCAVPLEHLADYTARLTDVFEKHGTRGTWYAHASVGCLHVRPVLNLRLEKDVKAMRAIAEEAFAMVRDYKGSHSGEHGDGIVRSEFHDDDVRRAAGARLRGGQGPLRSERPASIPARSCARRNSTTARCFRYGPDYRADDDRTRARLVGLSRRRRRFPGRGRDVQQQRRLPRARRRRHVPELPRHPRRARRHPRPRQHAAPRASPASSAPTRSPRTRWRRR